ncbi:MAG: hypothetical protein K6G73_12360 [Marinilabiliaceae bacterium]|nr:hypothetical protein [Marinilabiliaceae bacterium]
MTTEAARYKDYQDGMTLAQVRELRAKYETTEGKYGLIELKKETSSREFKKKLLDAKKDLSEDSRWRVDDTHAIADYRKDKKYVTKGGSTFAITPDGDIISVARPNTDKNISGGELLQLAVKKGGKKLDSFDGNYYFYVKNGFEPVSWVKFDERQAPNGWRKGRDSAEPVVFFKYTGHKTTETKEQFYKRVKASKDYNSALLKREKSLKRKK